MTMKSSDTSSTKSTKAKKATEKRKERFLKAFDKLDGHIAKSCEAIKIDRGTYYLWMDNDKEFAKQVEAVRERLIDEDEAKLLEHIRSGSLRALTFRLETQGKKRGYIKGQFFLGDVVQREGAVDNEEFEKIRKMLKL